MPADFVEHWFPLQELARKLAGDSNLANKPEIEAEAMAILAKEIDPAQSGQGFLASPRLRKAVEEHAMQMAMKHLESVGYKVNVLGNPYDLLCSAKEKTLYVEVKGTTTDGLVVLLTPNEIAFARKHKGQIALYVVHGIEMRKLRPLPKAAK